MNYMLTVYILATCSNIMYHEFQVDSFNIMRPFGVCFYWLLLSQIVAVSLVNCEERVENTTTSTFKVLTVKDEQCPPWFFYNATTNKCECYRDPRLDGIIRCTSQTALLRFGFCTTFEKDHGFFVTHCNYFNPKVYDTTDDNYIILPQNRSELNGYMCDPLNREGRVCSQCMDGFGPAVFSTVPTCSNCMDAWYGIPVYLFLEFVPITIFYFIVVIFRINVTSAPMVAFVLFCHVTLGAFQVASVNNSAIFQTTSAFRYFTALVSLYGIWNLDFLRYEVFPPFCVSPNIKAIHITYLSCISAIYPICLTAVLGTAIKLYSNNNRALVWSWNKLNKYFLKYITFFGKGQEGHNTMIDVIATFFLLSYAKLLFVTTRAFSYRTTWNLFNDTTLNNYLYYAFDPSITYFSREHTALLLFSNGLFLILVVPLTLLLSLFPIKRFRSLLFKTLPSRRLIVSINIFTDKFFSSYRDGIDGKRDKRGFIVLYFLLRLTAVSIRQDETFIAVVIIYTCSSVLIAITRPYKRAYMNILDPLIILNIGVTATFLDRLSDQENPSYLTVIYRISAGVLGILPLLGLIAFILYKIVNKERKSRYFHNKVASCLKKRDTTTKQEPTEENPNYISFDSVELPDRVIHPEEYQQR